MARESRKSVRRELESWLNDLAGAPDAEVDEKLDTKQKQRLHEVTRGARRKLFGLTEIVNKEAKRTKE